MDLKGRVIELKERAMELSIPELKKRGVGPLR